MLRKIDNEIIINQDFYGSYGLYLYENKTDNYFALSNSFLLLEEYLVGKQNISLNKDFADNFIISGLCSPSIYETLINEIIMLPANIIIIISIRKRNFKFLIIDYKEHTVPIDSEQGQNIIDNWVDKWGYIFRSLHKQTDNLAFDLSGGFDTRISFSILISSGINLKNIYIKSYDDQKKNPAHIEDLNIAINISSKYGFKLNDFSLDNKGIIWSTEDALYCTLYSKLGFHKEFYLKTRFYDRPRFVITGFGGENIRGYPGYPIEKYIENISSQGKKIDGYEGIFYNSSLRLCKRSVDLLKREKNYINSYEISSDLYSKGRTRHHFGRGVVEAFLANLYMINPLLDPEIMKINFNMEEKNAHDLIAYIYVRFAHDLIYFPIQGKRAINIQSIKKAERLNNKYKSYKIKYDANDNFFIDIKRKSPVSTPIKNNNVNLYLKELFKSSKFIQNIHKIYNNDVVYNWAIEYTKNTTFYPLRHFYGLLAISITMDNLFLNKKYLNKS